MADVCRAFRIATGFTRSGDVTRLANPPPGPVDISAVVRLARKLSGLASNP